MKKLKLYLAHNFDDRFKIRKIEKRLEKVYNIELLNPFYDVKRHDVRKLDEIGITRKEIYGKIQLWNKKTCGLLVERDLKAIRQSDGLLTIIHSATIGTSMEIISCAYFYRMPVYIITNTHYGHPWIKYMVYISKGKLFKNLKELEIWLEKEGYKKINENVEITNTKLKDLKNIKDIQHLKLLKELNR